MTLNKFSYRILLYNDSNSPKSYSYTDENLNSEVINYRLKQIVADGKFKYSIIIEVEIKHIPAEFVLGQNYPNPFNPTTNITFQLPVKGYVQLTVYDILGNEIQNLVNDFREAGSYNCEFDGSNLSSGIYFYSFKVDGVNKGLRKMILLK